MTFPVEICALKMEVPEPSVMTGLHPRGPPGPLLQPSFLSCPVPERSVPWAAGMGQYQRMPGTLSNPCSSGVLESPDGFFVIVTVFPCSAPNTCYLSPADTSRDMESCHLGKPDIFFFFLSRNKLKEIHSPVSFGQIPVTNETARAVRTGRELAPVKC